MMQIANNIPLIHFLLATRRHTEQRFKEVSLVVTPRMPPKTFYFLMLHHSHSVLRLRVES
jgi:hypothetical protein